MTLAAGSKWTDVTRSLVDKGVVSYVAIYSTKGRQWAASGENVSLTQGQLEAIISGFQVRNSLKPTKCAPS